VAQDLEAAAPASRKTITSAGPSCATEVDPDECKSNRVGIRPPRTRAWRDGKVVAEGFPVDQVSDHLEAGELVWLDLCSHRS
jgi:ferric-dicitrate binding protein FerR (iron transport regulator)